jgi:hypothetical protein
MVTLLKCFWGYITTLCYIIMNSNLNCIFMTMSSSTYIAILLLDKTVTLNPWMPLCGRHCFKHSTVIITNLDLLFPLLLTRLLPDLTRCTRRVSDKKQELLTLSKWIRVADLFSFLFFLNIFYYLFSFYLLCSVLSVSLDCPLLLPLRFP